MGMAAPQARLLNLTCRNADISRNLQHLANQKMSLTRESQKYSKEYNNALSSKTLKWTNNNGVTYSDLNYNTLMKPNAYNNKSPYLLTDANGRVVLNSKYTDYAKIISPNGAPGGDYEAHRTELLSQITGISQDSFTNSAATSQAADDAKKAMDEAKTNMEKKLKAAKATVSTSTIGKEYWGKIGNIDFGSTGKVELGKKDSAKSTLESLKNSLVNAMQNKFIGDKEAEAFKNAVEATITDLTSKMDGDKEFSDPCLTVDKDKYSLNVQEFISRIMSAYSGTDGVSNYSTDGNTEKYSFRKDEASWKEYTDAKAAYEEAKKAYEDLAQADEMSFSATEETQIAYYDSLFQSIADNGWVEDGMVEDENYLNQMMQNNFYTITTVTRNDLYEKGSTESAKQNKYNYDMNLSSNFDKIITVNDENAVQKAQADYEYKKSIINEKESRIDIRMKNLQTEQAAITKMMDSIKSILKENTEQSMSIFAKA